MVFPEWMPGTDYRTFGSIVFGCVNKRFDLRQINGLFAADPTRQSLAAG